MLFEAPFMINNVPERWKLRTISLATQLANTGPLIYSIISNVQFNKTMATNYPGKKDIVLSFSIISTEIVSLLLISIFWNQQKYVSERSIALLFWFWFVAVDCVVACHPWFSYPVCSTLSYILHISLFPGKWFERNNTRIIGVSQGLGEERTCLKAQYLGINLVYRAIVQTHHCNIKWFLIILPQDFLFMFISWWSAFCGWLTSYHFTA